MTEWNLATCSYALWTPEDGVPVQTSIGAPKWWDGPPLQDLRSAAPWGLMDVSDPAEFRRKYRARLHRNTPRILAQLGELATCYPGTVLVLMCFERRPQDCHRGLLAEWLSEHLGVEVLEIEPWA